jgi:molybdate/tungstate transport system permease protein
VAILVFYISGGLFSGTETASVLIYQYYGYYGPGPAITASAILIVISVAVLLAVKFLSRGRTITEKVIRA